MQMIDVLKRLAELDATNPNVVPAKKMVKENTDLAECGPMGMMGGMNPTPANISITAASGPELSGMLRDIMQLAGVHQVEPSHMGMDHDPVTLTAEPAMVAGPGASDGEIMRGVIDKMNPEMDDQEGEEDDEEQETDEAQYDNTPADPRKTNPFDSEEYANHENQPGQGDRMDGNRPKAYADMNEATAELFARYKTFVSESTQEVGQMMANDGITYSPEHEDEIIDKMAEYMKQAGMSSKQIRYLLNQEDYIPDQLSYLPRVKNQSMSQLEQKIRARLEQLEDEMEPEYAYEKVAHEFGMSQEELQHKLANGFDTDGGELDEISDKLAKSANQGRADRAELALRHAGTKTGFDGQVADLAAHRTSNALDRNYRMQDKRDARRAAS